MVNTYVPVDISGYLPAFFRFKIYMQHLDLTLGLGLHLFASLPPRPCPLHLLLLPPSRLQLRCGLGIYLPIFSFITKLD